MFRRPGLRLKCLRVCTGSITRAEAIKAAEELQDCTAADAVRDVSELASRADASARFASLARRWSADPSGSREQVDEVLHAFDKDVSKSIDYDEFQQVVSRCLVSHGRFT